MASFTSLYILSVFFFTMSSDVVGGSGLDQMPICTVNITARYAIAARLSKPNALIMDEPLLPEELGQGAQSELVNDVVAVAGVKYCSDVDPICGHGRRGGQEERLTSDPSVALKFCAIRLCIEFDLPVSNIMISFKTNIFNLYLVSLREFGLRREIGDRLNTELKSRGGFLFNDLGPIVSAIFN